MAEPQMPNRGVPRLDSDAAGQLLGYSIQFPRALVRLLELRPSGAVGIEVLGDVSQFSRSGEILLEEDKSSVRGNPVTDRSIDLWKTFHNWTKAIVDRKIDASKTQFVLYTNQVGRFGIVDQLHIAKTPKEIDEVLVSIGSKLGDLDSDHPAWKYFDYAYNQHADSFKQLVSHFELQTGKEAAFDDVRLALKAKIVSDDFLDFLSESLVGWLQKVICEHIVRREPALITFEDFSRKFSATFLSLRQQRLIDFASQAIPVKKILVDHLRERPTYVTQLEAIDLSQDEVLEAVSDFLRADYNRTQWIASEILTDTAAEDFEARLVSFWKNQSKAVSLTYPDRKAPDQGQLIYNACQSRPETLAGQTPPDRTVQGTYHAIANSLRIWWNPNWHSIKSGEAAK